MICQDCKFESRLEMNFEEGKCLQCHMGYGYKIKKKVGQTTL